MAAIAKILFSVFFCHCVVGLSKHMCLQKTIIYRPVIVTFIGYDIGVDMGRTRRVSGAAELLASMPGQGQVPVSMPGQGPAPPAPRVVNHPPRSDLGRDGVTEGESVEVASAVSEQIEGTCYIGVVLLCAFSFYFLITRWFLHTHHEHLRAGYGDRKSPWRESRDGLSCSHCLFYTSLC